MGRTLLAALRAATATLHTEAERSGIVRDILRGTVTSGGYILFLRNLLPAYRALESSLEQWRDQGAVGPFARPELYRAPQIERDLAALHGPDWADALPELSEARHYAERITASASDDPAALIGHAYARYLGDLSGGQILKRILATSLKADALSFFEFPHIDDIDSYKDAFRRKLDEAGEMLPSQRSVVNAAIDAFRLNIELSQAVVLQIASEGVPG